MTVPGPSDALRGAPWGPKAEYVQKMFESRQGYTFWIGHNGLYPVIVTPTTQAFEMAQTAMHELELRVRGIIGIDHSAPTLAQKIRDWYDNNGTELTVMYPVAGCLPAPLEQLAQRLFPDHNMTEEFIGPALYRTLEAFGYGERMRQLYAPVNEDQIKEMKEFARAVNLPFRIAPVFVPAANYKALPAPA